MAEKKLSAKQLAQLKAVLGEEAVRKLEGAGLTPTREGPAGDRTSEHERIRVFYGVCGAPKSDEDHKELNITVLMDADFPSASAVTNWSGVSNGSMAAWACGWMSSVEVERVTTKGKPGEFFKFTLKLRVPNEGDIQKRKEQWNKKYKTPRQFPMPGWFADDVEGSSGDTGEE